MPTDAGIMSKTQVENITAGSLVCTTIEQFAEALRGECSCYDYIYATRGTDETRADFGIRIEVRGWCKRRKELLAAYDGKEAGHGMATD